MGRRPVGPRVNRRADQSHRYPDIGQFADPGFDNLLNAAAKRPSDSRLRSIGATARPYHFRARGHHAGGPWRVDCRHFDGSHLFAAAGHVYGDGNGQRRRRRLGRSHVRRDRVGALRRDPPFFFATDIAAGGGLSAARADDLSAASPARHLAAAATDRHLSRRIGGRRRAAIGAANRVALGRGGSRRTTNRCQRGARQPAQAICPLARRPLSHLPDSAGRHRATRGRRHRSRRPQHRRGG